MSDKTGMIAGADPTAPGGMSQQALADELVERHGWTKQQVRSEFASTRGWSLHLWNKMIEAVVTERTAREAEFVPSGKPDDAEVERIEADDLDDLIAEFEDYAAQADRPDDEVDPSDQVMFLPDPHTADYIFDGHMGIGPSSAERWMTCTASVAAIKKFLETLTFNQQGEFARANVAARQGTTAHAAAEIEANVLLGRMDAGEAEAALVDLAVMPEDGEQYTDEMAEYIVEYTDLIASYADERGPENVLIETTVEACVPLMTVDSEGEQELHSIRGSADCIVLPTKAHPVLIVDDLKYGDGIDVDVDSNPQVRIYGLGALDLLTDEEGNLPEWLDTITYHIVQPRLGGIKMWTESIDDLLDWRDEVLSPALTEARGGMRAGAKFSPNDVSCQWCPVRGSCPALIEQRMEAAADLFEEQQAAEFEGGLGAFPETTTLDNATLGKLYAQILGLTSLKDDLKAEAQRRLYRGQDIPGFGLVNYQPPRKWTPEAEQEVGSEALGLSNAQYAALWRHQLVTPTAAEKLLGEEYARITSLVIKPEKVPVVAPEGDRRSKWEGRPPEAMFSVEPDESGAE